MSAAMALVARIAARQLGEIRVDFHQHQFDAGHAGCQRQARGADPGAEIGDAIARLCRCCRRQQYGVVTGAMARPRLPQPQLAAQECVLGADIPIRG